MRLENVLDHGDTVTDEYCSTLTLERLQQAIHHSRPGFLCYDIIILHSNSRLHTTNQTCDWLWCYGWEVNGTLPTVPISNPVTSDPSRSIWLVSNLHRCWPEESCHLLTTYT